MACAIGLMQYVAMQYVAMRYVVFRLKDKQ